MWQPRFIDVYDTFTLLQQRKHLLSIMHTHDEAALGVALVLYLLEHTITHVKVVTKNTANLSERVVKCLTLQQVNLDLLGCPDVLTELEIILDFLPESLALLLPDLQLLGESSIRII